MIPILYLSLIELILKSLCHLNVINKLNINNETYEEFLKDKIGLDATIFQLTQVGELCTKLTDEFKSNHNAIDFRGIIGLRNVMVHGYGSLHYDDIFDIVKVDVPLLINKYLEIVKEEYNVNSVDEYINNYYITRSFNFED